MANRTDEEWEQLAHGWRKAAGLDDLIRFDVISFIKWLKRTKHITDYVCLPIAEMPKAEARYEPDEQRIYYRDTTWDLAKLGQPHSMWTVLHEGCHVILKHKETRLRNAINVSQRFSTRQESLDEIATNRLTASMIAPFARSDYKIGQTPPQLMDRFGLSREAAERRLQEFARIYRTRNGLKRELPPGIVDFLEAQKKKGIRVTSLPQDSTITTLNDRRYEGDACPNCSEFKLVRLGLNMKCDACGARTGED